jgi:hypothetical protein
MNMAVEREVTGRDALGSAEQTLTVHVPLTLRRRGGRKLVLTPEGSAASQPNVDTTLLRALARGFRWRRLLEDGRYATVDELAKAERITHSYVARLLRLTLLAPANVEAVLEGKQPREWTTTTLVDAVPRVWTTSGC